MPRRIRIYLEQTKPDFNSIDLLTAYGIAIADPSATIHYNGKGPVLEFAKRHLNKVKKLIEVGYFIHGQKYRFSREVSS